MLKVPTGKTKGTFEVYKNGVTHSTRCAIIGYKGEEGLQRAIAEAKRRQAILIDELPSASTGMLNY